MNGPLKLHGNKNYDIYIKRFNAYLGKRKRIAPHIVPFLEGMKAAGLSPSTRIVAKCALWYAVSTHLSARGQFESLARFKLLFDQIKIQRTQKAEIGPDSVLSLEEMKAFTARCEPRYALIAWMLYYSGSRISVAMNIKLHDCRIDGNIVTYSAPGKGGRINVLNWPLDLHKQIIKEFQSVTHLFQHRRGKRLTGHLSVRAVQRYFQIRSGGASKNVHPHLLRHSCATRLLEQGANVKEISLWLNHSSVQTTLDTYCHANRSAHAQLARLNG